MGFVKFDNVRIKGIAVVVPEKEISIYDEAQYYDNNLKKIARMHKIVGFNKRRVVEEGICASDLATQAGENLLNSLEINRNDIDALIYVNQRPTYRGVVDAYEIHHRLSLSENCICTNVNQGCVGWVWGLYLCAQMLASGVNKNILLLNADTSSVAIDIADRNQAPIFGDAGSATLVTYDLTAKTSYFGIRTLSDGFDKIISPAGGTRIRYDIDLPSSDPFNAPLFDRIETKTGYSTTLMHGQLDGGAVFEFTVNEVPKHLKEILKISKLTQSDIAKLCLHQANKQIVQTIAMAADFSLENTPTDAFETYGNNTMCSIPTVLLDLAEKEGNFDSKPYLCSGFGNGLVIASSVLDFEQTVNAGIKTFTKGPDFKTRDEWIDYWKNKIANTNA